MRQTRFGHRPARKQIFLSLGAGLVFLVASAAPAFAQASTQEPSLIQYVIGDYDVADTPHAPEGRIEWRSGYRMRFGFGSLVGAMANGDGDVYGYAGIYLPFQISPQVYVIPSFAPGLWSRGDGKKLGHAIEFRSQIELNYRLRYGTRIGIALSHMSNAGIDDRNPGVNSVTVSFSIPMGQPELSLR